MNLFGAGYGNTLQDENLAGCFLSVFTVYSAGFYRVLLLRLSCTPVTASSVPPWLSLWESCHRM